VNGIYCAAGGIDAAFVPVFVGFPLEEAPHIAFVVV
jgi:hypothetical protein